MKNLIRILLALLLALPLAGRANPQDEKVMKEFSAKLKTLQQQFFSTEDLEQRLYCQKRLLALYDETIAQLSDEMRPLMKVRINIVVPIQQQSSEYLEAVSKFHQSGLDDPITLQTREEVATRIVALEALELRNRDLLENFTTLDARVNQTLDEGKVMGSKRASFLASFNQGTGRIIGPMKAIGTLNAQMFAEMKRIFRYLEAHWGEWKFKDGVLVWQDEATKKTYDDMLANLRTLMERVTVAEQQLSQRL